MKLGVLVWKPTKVSFCWLFVLEGSPTFEKEKIEKEKEEAKLPGIEW